MRKDGRWDNRGSNRGEHRLAVVAMAVLTIVPGVLVTVPDEVRADAATLMEAALPTGRSGTSAVWDGQNAYIFGGYGGSILNQIVRYNPSTSTVTTMSATLPTARYSTSAVWDGQNAYIFGGCCNDSNGPLNQIVRYTPGTDTVTTMSATLPTGRSQTSAVWDGQNAYIFGGKNSWPLNQVVRYNPGTDTVTTMSATLPIGRSETSAVWDGQNAYIFGGTDAYSRLNHIVRYNPGTDTVITMNATLPTGRYGTGAVWDGQNAYVFGGNCIHRSCNQVVRFNPSTDTLTTMNATLPTAVSSMSAVWDAQNAYIFGGFDGYVRLGQIVQYDPNLRVPGPPQALVAHVAPHRIQLTWEPPLHDGGTPVLSYRVYRAFAGGSETFLATVGTAATFEDAEPDPGVATSYRVTAVNLVGEGAPSEDATATIPGKVLVDAKGVALAPAVPLPPDGLPPVEVPLATVVGRNAPGGQYCVDVAVADGPPAEVACANTFGTGLPDVGPIVVATELVPAGALGATPSLTADVKVRFYYDPDHLVPLASAGSGAVVIKAPIGPDPAAALWLLDHGADVDLQVLATVHVDGQPSPLETRVVPMLGQVLGAVHESTVAGQPLL